MPEVDINSLLNAGIGGGGVWLAVRTELKYLWRYVRELKSEVKTLREKLELVRGH